MASRHACCFFNSEKVDLHFFISAPIVAFILLLLSCQHFSCFAFSLEYSMHFCFSPRHIFRSTGGASSQKASLFLPPLPDPAGFFVITGFLPPLPDPGLAAHSILALINPFFNSIDLQLATLLIMSLPMLLNLLQISILLLTDTSFTSLIPFIMSVIILRTIEQMSIDPDPGFFVATGFLPPAMSFIKSISMASRHACCFFNSEKVDLHFFISAPIVAFILLLLSCQHFSCFAFSLEYSMHFCFSPRHIFRSTGGAPSQKASLFLPPLPDPAGFFVITGFLPPLPDPTGLGFSWHSFGAVSIAAFDLAEHSANCFRFSFGKFLKIPHNFSNSALGSRDALDRSTFRRPASCVSAMLHRAELGLATGLPPLPDPGFFVITGGFLPPLPDPAGFFVIAGGFLPPLPDPAGLLVTLTDPGFFVISSFLPPLPDPAGFLVTLPDPFLVTAFAGAFLALPSLVIVLPAALVVALPAGFFDAVATCKSRHANRHASSTFLNIVRNFTS